MSINPAARARLALVLDFPTLHEAKAIATQLAPFVQTVKVGYELFYAAGTEAVTTFVDIVSRGGNLLLNIGLTASGRVPELQRRTLEHLAAWNAVNGDAVFGSTPLDTAIAGPSETPWLRWTRTGETANAFVDAAGEVRLPASAAVDAASARLADGNPVAATRDGDAIVLTLPRPELAGPTLVRFGLRG